MSVLRSIKFFVKSVVFGSLLAGCALYGVIASIVLRIVRKGEYAQYTVARAFYHSFSTLLGITVKIKNEERLLDTPAIFVSNHQSALDILILGKVFQPGYTVTGKKSLKYVPFLGWFMYLSGTFFLDRSKGEKARKVLESALASLKRDNRALFIFPEGTRSGLEKLDFLPFKKGAFHLAKQAGIPVIPLVFSNYSNLFNAKNKTFNRGEIQVDVLPPMSTEHLKTNEDVTEFAAKVREAMLASMKEVGFAKLRGAKEKDDQKEIDEEDVSDVNTDTDTSIEIISEQTPLVSKD
ncbi:1-acylglycerol-3-phosphate O [Suhomyces tanzawaensis NRRL Y-17324]|uniref:1-acyl-sn-glycerol-3-phosphate acyltransferase n=1 Tax=Suhomyces tanzawaensis NRRL Y-17324 TaxID=984487 RepID=A0A1E4SFZ8_9ASCO|nr:1-acylglycerol-3-phosphate O [Suhomyces tanzawaensis NRRL Y-17324]ODV78439.1 1-acylglycerol-3-phosphate O [Suhomyces tanzawaensis NRRL Y-17324]